MRSVKRISALIKTCAIIHNMLIALKDSNSEDGDDDDEETDEVIDSDVKSPKERPPRSEDVVGEDRRWTAAQAAGLSNLQRHKEFRQLLRTHYEVAREKEKNASTATSTTTSSDQQHV